MGIVCQSECFDSIFKPNKKLRRSLFVLFSQVLSFWIIQEDIMYMFSLWLDLFLLNLVMVWKFVQTQPEKVTWHSWLSYIFWIFVSFTNFLTKIFPDHLTFFPTPRNFNRIIIITGIWLEIRAFSLLPSFAVYYVCNRIPRRRFFLLFLLKKILKNLKDFYS